jgi:hypothetical protein
MSSSAATILLNEGEAQNHDDACFRIDTAFRQLSRHGEETSVFALPNGPSAMRLLVPLVDTLSLPGAPLKLKLAALRSLSVRRI